jgi:hypothetical protein
VSRHFVVCHNCWRPHRSLGQRVPLDSAASPIRAWEAKCKIIAEPVLGGGVPHDGPGFCALHVTLGRFGFLVRTGIKRNYDAETTAIQLISNAVDRSPKADLPAAGFCRRWEPATGQNSSLNSRLPGLRRISQGILRTREKRGRTA